MPLQRSLVSVTGCCVAGTFLLLSCSRSPQAKEAAFLSRGTALLAAKRYARAAIEYRNAIQAMPADAEPYYQLGIAYLQAGDVFNATRAFHKATELNPNHAAAQKKLAELLNLTQQNDLLADAASRLKRVLQDSPDDEEATDTLAITELQTGNTNAAIRRLQDSLGQFPARLKSSVALARIMLINKDLNGAEAVLAKAAAMAPDAAAAHLAFGQLELVKGDSGKAEAEAVEAVHLDPRSGAALLTLALVELQSNNMSQAGATLRRLASLPGSTYRDLYAAFLYRTGKRDSAIFELKASLDHDPDDSLTRSRLFSMYLDAHRLHDAEALLNDALARNSKDIDALLERSRLRLKSGGPHEAEEDVRQILLLAPDSPGARLQLARIHAVEGLINNARQEMAEALRRNKAFLPARLALAKSFLLSNEPAVALSILRDAPDSQKKDRVVLIAINWALLEGGRRAELRAALDRIPAADRVPEVLLQNALLSFQEKDYAHARAYAEEIIRITPEDPRAARVLADTYVAEHRIPDATRRLASLAASYPHAAGLQMLAGEWYLGLGQAAPAHAAFEAVLAADPDFVPAAIHLAEIDIGANRSQAARNRLQGILAKHPENVPALLLLASLNQNLGNRAGEIAAYRSALAVDPSNEFALNNLACALAIEDPNAALPLAERAVTLAPDNAAAQDTLGWIYYRKHLYAAAADHLKLAVDRAPNPRREFHLAMAYLKTGRADLGKALLDTALQHDPTLPSTE